MITTVICPRCQSETEARAQFCPRCGASLIRYGQPAPTSANQRITDRPWFIVLVLLHVGFLGIPYFLKTNYSLRARWLMCIASIAYTLIAVGIIIWGCLQILNLFSTHAPKM